MEKISKVQEKGIDFAYIAVRKYRDESGVFHGRSLDNTASIEEYLNSIEDQDECYHESVSEFLNDYLETNVPEVMEFPELAQEFIDGYNSVISDQVSPEFKLSTNDIYVVDVM